MNCHSLGQQYQQNETRSPRLNTGKIRGLCSRGVPCENPSMPIDKDDADALRNAVKLLEYPSLAARLTNMVGKPVELLGRALPAGASQAIATATTKSLEAALKVALLTIRGGPQESSQLLHRALAVASGAAGGAFGIFSLPIELPVSTIIILRSILDIA